MKNIRLVIGTCILFGCNHPANHLESGTWQASLLREDGKEIPFSFKSEDSAGQTIWHIENGNESLLVDNIEVSGDSVKVQMPFYDSKILAKLVDGKLQGEWIKTMESTNQTMQFTAAPGNEKFNGGSNEKQVNVEGRWAVNFVDISSTDTTHSVGEFKQDGNKVTGTFLNPTGDYRFLSGIIIGDTLKLSCFDGGHAFLFTAIINDTDKLSDGYFYSGAKYVEKWTAQRNDSAQLADEYALTKLKAGAGPLNFKFRSITGDSVSMHDDRFKNKVVLVQLMGSWCPNCMDETAFLSDYYNQHKNDSIEIISLAYERSTDFERSKKTLGLFQKRFNVQYPMLVTGVTVTDTMRTEKTLPQLEEIIAFPTLIFVDKKGAIRKIHSGFTGPGTGEHYRHFKDDFDKIVGDLLKEN